MNRRHALILLGGALASVQCRSAKAQMARRRVAIAHVARTVEEMEGSNSLFAAFRDELRRLGWIEGSNLITEVWSGRGRTDRGEYLEQIFASQPDVIFLAGYLPLVTYLRERSNSIPIVVLGPDPLGTGLVRSLSHPDGGVTGVTNDGGLEIMGKRLQLLTQFVPTARDIAYFGPRYYWDEAKEVVSQAAERLGVAISPTLLEQGSSEDDARRALTSMGDADPDALLLGQGAENNAFARTISEYTFSMELPAIGFQRDFAEFGMLLSYGPNFEDVYRHAADYVNRILNGAATNDLPIQQPTKFDLTINAKTAKEIGLQIPRNLMIQATEIIE